LFEQRERYIKMYLDQGTKHL